MDNDFGLAPYSVEVLDLGPCGPDCTCFPQEEASVEDEILDKLDGLGFQFAQLLSEAYDAGKAAGLEEARDLARAALDSVSDGSPFDDSFYAPADEGITIDPDADVLTAVASTLIALGEGVDVALAGGQAIANITQDKFDALDENLNLAFGDVNANFAEFAAVANDQADDLDAIKADVADLIAVQLLGAYTTEQLALVVAKIMDDQAADSVVIEAQQDRLASLESRLAALEWFVYGPVPELAS